MIRPLALAAGLAALAIGGTAQASTLSGTYDILIYNYDAGGSGSAAAATPGNITGKSLTAEVSYTGAINFGTTGAPSTIEAFLDSAGGSYSVLSGDVSGIMSVGGFSTTTLFDIYGTLASAGNLTVRHDDGVSFCQTASGCDTGAAGPTVATNSIFAHTAGDFRLIYSAANGNPEVLTAAVPLPATGFLLFGGLAGLAGLRRRRKSA